MPSGLGLHNDISGTGALVKVGSNELGLYASNIYSGGTQLEDGTIEIHVSQALGTGQLTMSDGTTLQSLAGVTLSNAIALNGVDTLDTEGPGSPTAPYTGGMDILGVISGTGELVKTGALGLRLSGDNTYSGGTLVEAGHVGVDNDNAFGTGPITFDGGFLVVHSDGHTINNAATLDQATIFDTQTLSLTYAGAVSGAGSLIKVGSGTLVLSGANSYAGGTLINQGIVQPVQSSSLGTGQVELAGGTLQIAAPGAEFDLPNAIAVDAAGGTIDSNGAHPLAIFGAITDGTSPGTLVFMDSQGRSSDVPNIVLYGSNTSTGGAVVRGDLQVMVAADNALGHGSLEIDAGGAVSFAGNFNQTVTTLTGAGAVFATGYGASSPTSNTLTVANGTFSGRLLDGFSHDPLTNVDNTGVLSLTKLGSGVLNLTGASTYSGGTSLEGGTLSVGSNTALGTGPLAMAQGTTLTFATNGLNLANSIQFTQPGDPTIDTGPNDVTISGSISGPGDLDKIGTGTLDLTGTSTYTGATMVQQGTLLVDGSTANSVATVDNGATLGGSGTVGGFSVLAGGTLAPGFRVPYTTLRVAGNGTFAAGSTYAVDINAGGQSDAVAIAGAATINGGTVAVSAASGSYGPASRYTILTADGGRTGQFGALTTNTNFAFLTPMLSYDPNHVYLGFTQTASFQSVAATQNERAVANAVQSLGPGNPLYQAVLTQSPAGAQQAFKSLSGEAHASAPILAVSGGWAVSGAVFDRFWNIAVDGGGDAASVLGQFGSTTSPALLRCYTPEQTAAAGGTVPSAYTVWGQAIGDFFRSGGDGNASSVDNAMGGVSFGIDTKVDNKLFNNWRVGIAGGYTNDSYSVGQGGGQGTFENAFGTLYGGARYGAVDVRLGASYGGTNTTTHRTVAFPGFNEAERANYGGDTIQGFGELGYRIGFSQAVFEPIVDAGVTHVHQDGYHEKGGVAALTGFAQDTDVEFTTLGFRSEATPFKDVPLVARLMLGWEHSYGDINPASTSAFASRSAAFESYGTPLDRDAAVAETDLVWRATAATSVTLAYTGQIGQRDRENGVRGRIDYRF